LGALKITESKFQLQPAFSCLTAAENIEGLHELIAFMLNSIPSLGHCQEFV
jgi:hypothetical protein